MKNSLKLLAFLISTSTPVYADLIPDRAIFTNRTGGTLFVYPRVTAERFGSNDIRMLSFSKELASLSNIISIQTNRLAWTRDEIRRENRRATAATVTVYIVLTAVVVGAIKILVDSSKK